MKKPKFEKTDKVTVQGSGKRLTAAKREAFKNYAIDLYLKGWSYRKIADAIEDKFAHRLSMTAVSRYVRGMIEEWKKHSISKIDDLKTVELQRINRLEETFWDAWYNSLEAYRRITEKQKAVPSKKGEKAAGGMTVLQAEKIITNNENFHGDPRYLSGVQWCISMRCKILGIESPVEFRGIIKAETKQTTIFKTRDRKKH